MTSSRENRAFRGRAILVTGANRGLGLELCRQLAERGARVIGTARRPRAAIDLRTLEVRVEELDVTSPESVAGLASRLGDTPLDILVNNAGIGEAGPGIAALAIDDVAKVLEVNSLGPLRVAQALLPHLRRGSGRTIVNISTRMASLGDNSQGGYYAYRSSKTALNMLTRCMALELVGQGFVCVALHPGWVRTGMGGTSAPLSPQESVDGMLRVIGGLQRSDTGRFIDHTGARLPW